MVPRWWIHYLSFFSCTTMRLTSVVLGECHNTYWMKFDTDIHVPLRVNCYNFGHPLTFHLASASNQKFILMLAFSKASHVAECLYTKLTVKKRTEKLCCSELLWLLNLLMVWRESHFSQNKLDRVAFGLNPRACLNPTYWPSANSNISRWLLLKAWAV